MAKILIIDDNKAASAFLKLMLQHDHHQVSRSREVAEATHHPRGFNPDLVLIHHAFRNNSGWQVFSDLKQIAPDLPAMVYLLEDFSAQSAGWVVGAVDAVMRERRNATTAVRAKKAG